MNYAPRSVHTDATAMQTNMPEPQTRVVKRLSPTQSGALKHAERYGSALICVRYRRDLHTMTRYTTVEIIVDEGPVRRRDGARIVAVRLMPDTEALRRRLISLGALWNGHARCWYLPRSTAKSLNLLDQVVRD